MATYDIFISHAWQYGERYMGVCGLLETAKQNDRYFTFRNYSVPKHDPLIDPATPVGERKLTQLLDEQIRQASCFIVIAGMYVDHRFWIQKEIEIAKSYVKPMVGIRRRGQMRTPEELVRLCNQMVNWNSDSLKNAIKLVCRPS